MCFQTCFNQIFAISNPSPSKMESKLANITKIAIFCGYWCKRYVNVCNLAGISGDILGKINTREMGKCEFMNFYEELCSHGPYGSWAKP